jgi:hypothetical protein
MTDITAGGRKTGQESLRPLSRLDSYNTVVAILSVGFLIQALSVSAVRVHGFKVRNNQ